MHPAIANADKGPIFFWNVDYAVGKDATNAFEDVLFVQWCLYKLSKWQGVQEPLRSVLANADISGACTGRDGDSLVDTIKALQTHLGLPVDGRVSPAKAGGTYSVGAGRSTFLIIYPLNAVLWQLHPDKYPRIDLMPQFVWRIKDRAVAPFNW